MDQRVKLVADLIADNLHREMPLAYMAHHVNLSPSRLRHLFKIEIGISLYQYLKMLRMQKAKELLGTTFLSIKEIMCRVGARDQSRFSYDFKRIFGMTPSEYRECRHSRSECGAVNP